MPYFYCLILLDLDSPKTSIYSRLAGREAQQLEPLAQTGLVSLQTDLPMPSPCLDSTQDGVASMSHFALKSPSKI